MITKFEDYKKMNEQDGGGAGSGDSGGGGGAFATLGSTGGMGDVVAPQPGGIPGTYGSVGSGDVPAGMLGPFYKSPAYSNRSTKKKKRKKKRWL